MNKVQEHLKFINKVKANRGILYHITEPIHISALYWIANSLRLLGLNTEFQDIRQETLEYILLCKNTDGGFGGCKGYPSMVLATFHALQLFYMFGEKFCSAKTRKFILSMKKKDGSFANDVYGEVDNRFSCCAVSSLHLLDLLEKEDFTRESLCKPINIDDNSIVSFILKCYNMDGGFGAIPGAESHSAQTFCCVSTLRTLGKLDCVDTDEVSKFLAFRQAASGGLSGRINKKEDSCYSFWAYSALLMIGKSGCIDEELLLNFIIKCEGVDGGFSDRPGNEVDVYHMMFSLAAISLLKKDGRIDPGFAV